MELVQLKPKETKLAADQKQAMVDFLQLTLDRVKADEIEGMIVVSETKTGYEYTKLNTSIQSALALHTRGIYKLNQDWDRP